jgi:hypothetical protein
MSLSHLAPLKQLAMGFHAAFITGVAETGGGAALHRQTPASATAIGAAKKEREGPRNFCGQAAFMQI